MACLNVGFANNLGISPSVVQSFYRDNWKRRIALSDDRFYRWQFIDNPENEGRDECAVALIDSEIVGVMGLGSRTFWVDGCDRKGAELTTWVVSEFHRNKGVGPAIIQFLQEKYEVLLGTGITSDALSVYLRSGFQYIRYLPRYLRVFDLSGIEPYSHVEPLGKKLSRQRNSGRLGTSVDYTAVELNPALVDSISHSFAVTHNFFDRDYRYFSWRYLSHPYFQYETVCLRGPSERHVLIVTRTEDLPNGAKILRVIDIIGHDEMYAAAAAYIDSLCILRGYSAADFFCTTAHIQAVLRAKGWFSILDEPFIQFPHLFSPIELRMPPTTSLILWANERLESLLNISKLYVAKSDADLDRPTLETLERL